MKEEAEGEQEWLMQEEGKDVAEKRKTWPF